MTYPTNFEKITEKDFFDLFQTKSRFFFDDYTLTAAYKADVSFYTDTLIIRGEFEKKDRKATAFFLNRQDRFYLLDFTNSPIYRYNDKYGIQLNASNVFDYIRFFFTFVKGGHGHFYVLTEPDDLAKMFDFNAFAKMSGSEKKNHETHTPTISELSYLDSVLTKFVYPKVRPINKYGVFEVDVTLLFKDNLFYSLVNVDIDGIVNLSNERLLADGVPVRLTVPDVLTRDGTMSERIIQNKRQQNMNGQANIRKLDLDMLEKLTEVLIREALMKQDSNVLFTSALDNDSEKDPLKRFANMVMHARPVVVFVSHIPYIEEVIADLIMSLINGSLQLSMAYRNSENGMLHLPAMKNDTLLTIPMHSFAGIENESKVARDITITNASIFIGCHSFQSLPFALRELTDYVLPIPDINPHNFKKIFSSLFKEKLPDNLLQKPMSWANMLLPNDIIQASRLNIPAEATLQYLQERINDRMNMIVPEDSPTLKDLHGLGEAKVIMEDLIMDIKDAEEGKISWHQVDKGMLMVGPPGTGKTTLAKAVAKEGGIKFIHVSAAQWQAVDHLGQHVAKITADFALARRYAPCIMFIDEFDSIGSREKMNDRNAHYQNMVINTLLQEIQGFTEKEKVIIIGATNFEELVDPALRRAGRLDQVVHVNYPTVDALEKIYGYYLKPFQSANKLEQDIDVKELAGISFGLTGADIEQIVRGAVRRARKDSNNIKQIHLIDEITGKPRDQTISRRIVPDEMKKIAVHEAGHTVLRIMNGHGKEDLAFVSIVPRNDGKLGFVASVPSSSVSYTKQDYLEMLEILLGGRAAEEAIYGKEGISSGSGGDENSDLGKATKLASSVVAHYGFGESEGLLFSKTMMASQVDEVKQLLNQVYQSALDKLLSNKQLLLQIIDILMEKQEITGKELRKMIDYKPD